MNFECIYLRRLPECFYGDFFYRFIYVVIKLQIASHNAEDGRMNAIEYMIIFNFFFGVYLNKIKNTHGTFTASFEKVLAELRCLAKKVLLCF